MIGNTWRTTIDMVKLVVDLGYGAVDIVHGVIEDVQNLGDKVGNMVSGNDPHEEDEDWGGDSEENLDEDAIAELLQNVRKDAKRK